MQKQISTLSGLIIIVVATVIIFGGLFAYQYYLIFKFPQQIIRPTISQKQQILNKKFPLAGGSDTADQAAGWKTYTNTQYGFEIKYPSGWDNRIGGQGEKGAYSLLSLDINKNSSDFSINRKSYVRLVVEDNNFVLGTRDWKNFKLGQINGLMACDTTGCEIIFNSVNSQKFLIDTKFNPLADSTTSQILSTFKFTN